MHRRNRRVFLKSGLELGGALLLGCGEQPGAGAGNPTTGTANCPDTFEGSELVGLAAFVDESSTPLERAFNAGLDGRLYTDLSKLGPTALITPTEAFYIRTRYPDLLVPGPSWTLQVSDGSGSAREIDLADLMPMERAQGARLLECSGNGRGASFGLLSSALWDGIGISDALDAIGVPEGATRVLVSGFDEHSMPSQGGQSVPGASWVFTLDELVRAEAFLATRMNGEALPPDHGAPVRLFVPGWYGCTCIKWVNEIRFVGDDEPASAQMQEFASRTHQEGTPALARDYQPAEIDNAAMPIRVEKRRVGDRLGYGIVGIEWGGRAQAPALEIRVGDRDYEPVSLCPPETTTRTWSLWTHAFYPDALGNYAITLRIPDPGLRTRRLDSGYYLREVAIDEL